MSLNAAKIEEITGITFTFGLYFTLAFPIGLVLNALLNLNPSWDFYPPTLLIDWVILVHVHIVAVLFIAFLILEFINIWLHPEWG